jgi:hypothetical protein
MDNHSNGGGRKADYAEPPRNSDLAHCLEKEGMCVLSLSLSLSLSLWTTARWAEECNAGTTVVHAFPSTYVKTEEDHANNHTRKPVAGEYSVSAPLLAATKDSGLTRSLAFIFIIIIMLRRR